MTRTARVVIGVCGLVLILAGAGAAAMAEPVTAGRIGGTVVAMLGGAMIGLAIGWQHRRRK